MTDIEPVPAATVVLIRENARQQELEVLLVQRNSRLVFHGGHWVSPVAGWTMRILAMMNREDWVSRRASCSGPGNPRRSRD